jgi:hypothetical protein
MRYRNDTGGAVVGWTAAATLLLAFLWVLTLAYDKVVGLDILLLSGSIVATVVAAFPSIVRFIPVLRKPAVRDRILKVALLLAGLIIPLGAIALSFWFYYLWMTYAYGWMLLLLLTFLFGTVALFLLNINLTGPHRLYRDQLARTFIHVRDDGTQAPVALHTINPDGFAPYHLINTTVNLPTSGEVKLRERKSDFFLFSKHWCGAPSFGYTETAKWRTGDAPVDLATAMAVSGAAASSYMGLGSFPTLTAMLTFLNVRLGYWIRRPSTEGAATLLLRGICGRLGITIPNWIRLPDSAVPGVSCLMREMLGIQMSEKEAWINLSDGGHIENMGVYELLRRRCKFIISVDGEADPQSTFHGHLTLVRHAQIDFGIRIEPDLTAMRPDLTSQFSQSHVMMCRVHYPKACKREVGNAETADKPQAADTLCSPARAAQPAAIGAEPAGEEPPDHKTEMPEETGEEIGLILYLKLSVTGNELELIKKYRLLHPDFPHESTLDQFFDEEQFEVYRQLGVHAAEGLFSRALVGSGRDPTTVKDWFGRLAIRLLLPEPRRISRERRDCAAPEPLI